MFNKEVYLKSVASSLTLLSKEIEIYNAVNLYDINIVAEDFYAELLNLIYGYNLKNVNIIEKNAPAIDLIDEKARISIQVTSDNTSDKIKHTISEYIKNESYKKYDRMLVLILTEKKKYTTDFDTQGKFSFDKRNDILDTKDLIKVIRGLSTSKIKEIDEFLDRELCQKVYRVQETQASEVDTIIDLIEYISKHKKVKNKVDVVIDPDYKIYNRFREFANRLISEYTSLLTIYGEAIIAINEIIGSDAAQDIITIIYLQDISIQYLDKCSDDPVKALNELVTYFEEKLSLNGKKYDRAAIKFYLVNEMIKCRVFPNKRSEYNGNG